MTTKANRTREAEKRIEQAKREYGLAEPDNVLLRVVYGFAESPWSLVAVLVTLVACVVVLIF